MHANDFDATIKYTHVLVVKENNLLQGRISPLIFAACNPSSGILISSLSLLIKRASLIDHVLQFLAGF